MVLSPVFVSLPGLELLGFEVLQSGTETSQYFCVLFEILTLGTVECNKRLFYVTKFCVGLFYSW